jgi:outer membrane receptor protein involved in Fe transport
VKDLLKNSIPGADVPVDQQIEAGALVFAEASTEAETSLKYDHIVDVPGLGRVQAGANAKTSRIDYDVASPFGSDSPFFIVPDANPFTVTQQFSAYQVGAYAQATRTVVPRLDVTAGGRIDSYEFISATRVSPRLGADVSLSPRVALRVSYGQYYQPPFFLFLTAYPENRALKPFRANHYVGGIRFDLDTETQVSVETYRKTYSDYPVSSEIPALSLANVGDTFAVRNALFPMVSSGRGVVTGVEASLQRKPQAGGRLSGEANLSFSRSRYAGLDGVLRPGSFDYPVVANVTGSIQLSAQWKLSTKLSYLGGRPYTPLDLELSTQQRRAVYDLAQVNAQRSPDYFRQDVRIDWTIRRGDRVATIFAGAQNVTNRRNFAGYSWDRRNNRLRTLDQLGLFPIVGLEWPF